MMLVPSRGFDFFSDLIKDPLFNVSEKNAMKTDIKEYDNKYLLSIDLPGYNKDNIEMLIDDGYLVINAKSIVDSSEDEGTYIRRERFLGECSRSFYVGDDIVEDDIKASFKNGILNVEIPKKDKSKKNEKKYIQIEE